MAWTPIDHHPAAWILGALALGAAAQDSGSGGPGAPAAQPNILLLFGDDHRADAIGALGNDAIETPNLDRLVDAGFSFERAYCLGSPHGAVCIPSRAMLHTGRPYFGLDLDDFDGHPTLGGLLGEAGYTTFATGKWHNGRGAFARSFQRGRAVFFGGMADHNAVPLVDFEGGEFANERVGEGHSSRLFADAAIDFLQSYEDDAPFLLYAAFTAPHDPRDPPAADRESYYERRPPLPGNLLPWHPFDNGFLTVRDEKLAAWPRTESVISDQLAEYYALITDLDEQIGRILAALRTAGHPRDTVIVYAADHGLAIGSHGLLGKQSLYEHSTRAPLVLAGAGIPHGSSDALVYLLDLFPTLLARAGVERPADAPLGRDLAALWSDPRAAPRRESLFTAMGTSQRAVRDARYKLIRYPKVDVTQLFDLESDPLEVDNRSGDPALAERVAHLRGELEAWQARVGDDLAWSLEPFEPAEVDLSGAEREPDRWQPAWIREKYFGD